MQYWKRGMIDMTGIIIAILIFSFIIIFHEMGHYLVAKKCDVKVNEFQLGLGPRLFGIPRGETMFSVHLFPFGGACVMQGEMDDDTADEKEDETRSFNSKNVCFEGKFKVKLLIIWRKALIKL